MNDLELLEDLITETANEAIRTCDFETYNLCMVAGLEEDRCWLIWA